ncbi:MAG: thioredoxin family protein [Gammaproteobacteria bacterium]|nr:thioredoxin family protein [Gammaproteobacteria bacterium]
MSWVLATVLLLVALAIAFQLSLLARAKRMEGERAPALADEAEDGDGGSRLLYFHSRNCAPCRRMSPTIEALIVEYGRRVRSIEISEHPQMVDDFRIRATPTTMLVRDGNIEKVMLGFQPEARLRALLGGSGGAEPPQRTPRD